MSNSVNNSALSLTPWSGFQPCVYRSDCIFSNETQFDFLVVCKYLTQGPEKNQKYCLCDFSLGGESCSIITAAATKEIVCFVISSLLSLWPLLIGVWEIKERRKVKQSMDPVYVSLWISTASMLFVFAYGATGIYMIVAGQGTPGITYVRSLRAAVLLPLCIATSFSSAMIISLEFLKIANDPVLGGNWNRAKERRVRSFVVAACVSIILGYALVYISISSGAGSLFMFMFVIGGSLFSWSSGRQFKRVARIFVTDVDSTPAIVNVNHKFEAAIKANRQTSWGLFGMILINVIVVVLEKTVDESIKEDGFDVFATVLVVSALVLCFTSHASINFGRTVRLIRPPKTQKTVNQTMASGLGSLFSTSVVSVRPSRGLSGLK